MSIYQEIYTPFMMYKYFGFTSFTIKNISGGCKRLVSRKIDILIQALIMLFITFWNIYCWVHSYTRFVETDLLFKLFVRTLAGLIIIGTFLLFFNGLRFKQHLPIIFAQINKLDTRLFQIMQGQIQHRKCSTKIILLTVRIVIWGLEILIDVSQNYFWTTTLTFATYYIFYAMILVSSTMFCYLIIECQKRVKIINDYIEKLFFGSRFVACIETKLTPIVNIPYKLEDIKSELSVLIKIVENINRYFEIVLFVKTVYTFVSVLWSAFYFIEAYEKSLDLLLTLKSVYYMCSWSTFCVTNFCIDVYFYKRLLREVS